MKVQIRQGVFETNSSSTHAISVMSYDKNSLIIPEEICFHLNSEFGWEFRKYNDRWSKADYLWLLICNKYDKSSDKDKLDDIKKHIKNVLKNAGVKTVNFETGGYINPSWNPNDDNMYMDFDGYIDHASDAYGFIDILLNDDELLLSYLFNNTSCIETGNDNSDVVVGYVDDAVVKYYKGN